MRRRWPEEDLRSLLERGALAPLRVTCASVPDALSLRSALYHLRRTKRPSALSIRLERSELVLMPTSRGILHAQPDPVLASITTIGTLTKD